MKAGSKAVRLPTGANLIARARESQFTENKALRCLVRQNPHGRKDIFSCLELICHGFALCEGTKELQATKPPLGIDIAASRNR
jgi:hypothetical protein